MGKRRAKVGKPKRRAKVGKPKRRAKVGKPKRQLRDKLGRFTTRTKLRQQRKQEKVTKSLAKELSKKKPSYKVIQHGPFEEEYTGWFFLINAVVVGGWGSASLPVFEAEDELHWVVWRTIVRETIGEARAYLAKFLGEQTAFASERGFSDKQWQIISIELWATLDKPYQAFLNATFELHKMPYWIRHAP